jgi:hypothetical protein
VPLFAMIVSCSRTESGSGVTAKAPVVHTDAATVEKYVSLPGIVAVRWLEEPVVPSDTRTLVPGPSDYGLTAYVELDPSVWPALEKQLGGPKGPPTERPMKESWAVLILTAHVLEQLPRDGGSRIVTMTEYDIRSVRRGTRHGDTARRIGPGLLMSFSTM